MRSTLLGYGLLAPSLFGVVCFLLLPMLVVVWLSLHRWDLLGPISYAGLDNWRSVLTDPGFGNSLLVTGAFIAIVVPAQVVLGLAAAAMLARGLPGAGVFRALYVIPWICSPLAVAVLWRWILAPADGAVSTVLGRRIEWLTDPGLALPVVSAVTGVVSAAQVFDTVYALTGGGPAGRTDLVAHRIYAEAFGSAAIGRAAVMAMVLFVVLIGVTLAQNVYYRRNRAYELYG